MYFIMRVDDVTAPDARSTVVFKLKFPTGAAFLPGARRSIRRDVTRSRSSTRIRIGVRRKRTSWAVARFALSNIRSASPCAASAIPTITTKASPDLMASRDGDLRAEAALVIIDAIRADRASNEFRGLPPSARDQLVKELGDKITVQTSDWNCVNMITAANHKEEVPFDDPRVRPCPRGSPSINGRQAPCARRRSPMCIPSAAWCFPARHWRRRRRNCKRSSATGPTSTNVAGGGAASSEAKRGAEGLDIRTAKPQRGPARANTSPPG